PSTSAGSTPAVCDASTVTVATGVASGTTPARAPCATTTADRATTAPAPIRTRRELDNRRTATSVPSRTLRTAWSDRRNRTMDRCLQPYPPRPAPQAGTECQRPVATGGTGSRGVYRSWVSVVPVAHALNAFRYS